METLYYYLGLYLLVFVLKFIILTRASPISSNISSDVDHHNSSKVKWYKLIFVSSDIVNIGAGFAIAAIINKPNFMSSIMIFYIILVVLSVSVDSLSKIGDIGKGIIHFIIITTVISATFIGYRDNFGKGKLKENNFKFKVIIPYSDLSLIKHSGFDFNSAPENNFRIIVIANSKDSAILAGIDSFYQNNNVFPIYSDRSYKSKKAFLKINHDELTVIKVE
jgi:hypothetical protein